MKKLAISLFSSLNFRHDWKVPFMKQEEYLQVFSRYDDILVQFSLPVEVQFEIRVENICTGYENTLTPDLVESTEDGNTYNLTINRQQIGVYLLTITRTNIQGGRQLAYSYYKIDDFQNLIDNTILITATNETNLFNTIFTSEQEESFLFRFRIEGGFMPGEINFQVDSENFRDQRYSNYQLSADPYKTKTLTIGNGFGAPNWVAEKVNLLLSCSEVYINGVLHSRVEGASPEVNELGNRYYPKYVYKIELEETDNNSTIAFPVGSTEWLLRNGHWEDGIWTDSGTWHR